VTNIAFSGNSHNEQRASNSDRRWFARNPHRTYRARREIRGEFFGKRSHGIDRADFTLWTVVKQIEPGTRLRLGLFVKRGAEPIDADWTLAPLFECLLSRVNARDFEPATADSALGEAIINAFLPPTHVLSPHAAGGVR
jgi:hypothetical protein